MSRRKPIDWVVCRQEGLSFECVRCGATDAVALPAPVRVWAAAAKAFSKLHSECEPRSDANGEMTELHLV